MRLFLTITAMALATAAGPAVSAQRADAGATRALTGFRHVPGEISSGTYQIAPIRIGRWLVDTLETRDLAAFRAFERRPSRAPQPIVLDFGDTTSPARPDDSFASRYRVQSHLRLTAYYAGNSRFAFRGRAPDIGAVSFEGRFTNRNPETVQGVVLVGTLTIAGRVYRNAEFSNGG